MPIFNPTINPTASRRGAERGAEGRDTRADGARDLELVGPQADQVGHQFEESAGQAGADDPAQALGPHLAALEDFRRGDALGELELAVHDEAAPQRNGEQHAEHAAEAGDDRDPLVVERLPGPQQDQRRQREDAPGGNRLARGGAGLDDVVFENVVAFEKPQHPHRDDRGGDRGRHRHAGKQAQVRVGRRQNDRQHDAENDALDRDFRKRVVLQIHRVSISLSISQTGPRSTWRSGARRWNAGSSRSTDRGRRPGRPFLSGTGRPLSGRRS